MGSVSDRCVTLANEVARAVNGLGLGDKYVGMYAYNQHSAPPKVKVDPHVIPSATTAFIGGGFTFDQVVRAGRPGATMGVYDYLSVVDWDWNLPRGGGGSRLAHLARFLPRDSIEQGIRFYDAESGDCWGPCGLGYYVARRMLWDIREAQRLGRPGRGLSRQGLRSGQGADARVLPSHHRGYPAALASDIVGRMYRQLDAARRKTSDPQVLDRIDHLILYARHAELYYAYANRGGSVEDVARHAYRMRKTMMVHSYGLWCRPDQPAGGADARPSLEERTALQPGRTGQDPGRRNRREPAGGPRFRRAGVQPEPGPGRTAQAGQGAPGSFPDSPQDHQQYYVWVPEGVNAST